MILDLLAGAERGRGANETERRSRSPAGTRQRKGGAVIRSSKSAPRKQSTWSSSCPEGTWTPTARSSAPSRRLGSGRSKVIANGCSSRSMSRPCRATSRPSRSCPRTSTRWRCSGRLRLWEKGGSPDRGHDLAVAQEHDLRDARAGDGASGKRGAQHPSLRRQQFDARQLVEDDGLAAAEEVEIRDVGRRLQLGNFDRVGAAHEAAPEVVLGADLEAVGARRQATVEVECDVRCVGPDVCCVDRNAAADVMGDDEGVGEPVAQEDIARDRHPVEDLPGAEFVQVLGWQQQPATHRRAPVLAAERIELERDAAQGHGAGIEDGLHAQEVIDPARGPVLGPGRCACPTQPLDELSPACRAFEPPLQPGAFVRGQAAAAFRLLEYPERVDWRGRAGVVNRTGRRAGGEGEVHPGFRRPQGHRPGVEVDLLHKGEQELVSVSRWRPAELVFQPPAVVGPDLDPAQGRFARFDRLPVGRLAGQQHGALHCGRPLAELVPGRPVLPPAFEQARWTRRPEGAQEAFARARAFELFEGPALAVVEERLDLGEPLRVEAGQPGLGPAAALSFNGFRGSRGQRRRGEQQRRGRAHAAAPTEPPMVGADRASTPAGVP